MTPSFQGSIPAVYQQHLVPLIFEPYARDLAARARGLPARRVLELAAGTGVVTRQLALALPSDVAIDASDLSQPMLDQAASIGTSRPVHWRQADVHALPYPDSAFELVVSQFGVMFFSDKPRAFAEVRRVLAPGGVFLFNVWDRLEANELPNAVTEALAGLFPDDPPTFMRRIPHGYHEPSAIARDLGAGGFTSAPTIETVAVMSHADDAHAGAVAFCCGTPLRPDLEARASGQLDEIVAAVTRALTARFGTGPFDTKIQALVVSVRKSS
jgi:SAM-dependent methyltransferase